MKAKIAKRFLLLCIALVIAIVITFGRPDRPPAADRPNDTADPSSNLRLVSSEVSAENSSAQVAQLPGLPELPAAAPTASENALPSLPAVQALQPNSGPADGEDRTNGPAKTGLSDLNELPALTALEPPKPAVDTAAPTNPPLAPMASAAPAATSATGDQGLPPLPSLDLAPLNASSSPAVGSNGKATEPNTGDLNAGDLKKEKDALADSLRMDNAAGQGMEDDNELTVAPPDPFTTSATTVAPPKRVGLPAPLAPAPPTPTASPSPISTAAPGLAPAPALPSLGETSPSSVADQLPAAQPRAVAPPQPMVNRMPTAPPIASTRPTPLPTQGNQPGARGADRYHRIVDGDTLDSISQHYFGTPRYAMEIFNANRHQLQTPDLLPLNRQLVLPASIGSGRPGMQPVARTLPPGGAASAVPAAGGVPMRKPSPSRIENGEAQDLTPETRLVPVPQG